MLHWLRLDYLEPESYLPNKISSFTQLLEPPGRILPSHPVTQYNHHIAHHNVRNIEKGPFVPLMSSTSWCYFMILTLLERCGFSISTRNQREDVKLPALSFLLRIRLWHGIPKQVVHLEMVPESSGRGSEGSRGYVFKPGVWRKLCKPCWSGISPTYALTCKEIETYRGWYIHSNIHVYVCIDTHTHTHTHERHIILKTLEWFG